MFGVVVLDMNNQKDKIILEYCCTILYNIITKGKRYIMKKVILSLKPIEIEYLIGALNDSMENYKDDFEMFELLLDLKLKIRKEYEICTLLD